MNLASYILLAVILVALFFAIRKVVKKKAGCGYDGCCDGCAGREACGIDKLSAKKHTTHKSV